MTVICQQCNKHFNKTLSHIKRSPIHLCSRDCYFVFKSIVNFKQRKVSKFVKSAWINMNKRAGKYKHLRTIQKCKSYDLIDCKILFTRLEFKEWCFKQTDRILNLKRPSIDRIDNSKNYSLDNIQIIELSDNIRKKRPGSQYLNGPLANTIRGVRITRNGKFSARITYKGKEKHIGTFKTKEEALNAFSQTYFDLYKKLPF